MAFVSSFQSQFCISSSSYSVQQTSTYQSPVCQNTFPKTSTSTQLNKMPTQLSKLRAVLFDLDGTCVNSDHIHYEAYRDTILDLVPHFNHGKPITRKYYDEKMSGLQNPQLVASIFPNLSLNDQTHLWKTKEIRYEKIIEKGIDPIAGLLDIIDVCRQNSIQIFVVTNSPKQSCFKTMTSIGIRDKFETNVILAEECDHPKPHPAPYLQALKSAGVQANQAIAFEDSPGGTHSATQAGILTIGITSTQTDTVLQKAGATFTIPDYTAKQLKQALELWM